MTSGRLKYWLPAGVFLFLVVVLAIGLTLDPRRVPSPLIGEPAPAFQLAKLSDPDTRFSPADMEGKVWILNVWASWCVSCRAEHEVMKQLAAEKIVPIVGLNYKDKPADAREWLADLGNPYTMSVMDLDGRVGINWGVYGVPETFLIDQKGVVRYKYIGPVDEAGLNKVLIPKIKSLQES